MAGPAKPLTKPSRPFFSSGPCAKPPGWKPDWLAHALTSRSHRSDEGLARLRDVMDGLRRLIALPEAYKLAIVPGSDTGAFEMALWSLLGARGVDVLAWDVFGKIWVRDIIEELRLSDVRVLEADYGCLPDLGRVDCSRDVVFTANGTTAGVRVPDFDWIAPDRAGLTFCDATSAILAHPIDWSRIDVATFSWQKCLGGEAAHGVLVLSPRAVARAGTHTPSWPIPKLFRFVRDGALDEALFAGHTINTPSMLCVEDCARAIAWAESAGGLDGLMARAAHNAALVHDWCARTAWIENMAVVPATWSWTSVCLKLSGQPDNGVAEDRDRVEHMARLLAAEGVAFDIAGHRGGPPCLRIWTGPTVEGGDLEHLLPWLDWAFATVTGVWEAS